MFRPLIKCFQSLPAKERKQMVILVVLTAFTSYALAGAYMWEKMFNAEKLANRKENRIETRIGDYKEPDFDTSITPKAFGDSQQQLISAEMKLIELTERILPLDSPEPREDTKLAISRLASANNVEITSFVTHQSELRAMPEQLSGAALRGLFDKRPYFQITSRTDYYSFVSFIDGLATLPYQGFVDQLKIAKSEDESDNRLVIEFTLQM
ncbi:hypothetical protein [Neptunomonas sp. XY-337]|uniref:hypothetical protein n=1 Tax=Neptunomonas sp. XY-337 TaxID=2561897 RepID=UPI0010AA3074|nr:hypothetical protein [Neptunomonas sp. XY-337]